MRNRIVNSVAPSISALSMISFGSRAMMLRKTMT